MTLEQVQEKLESGEILKAKIDSWPEGQYIYNQPGTVFTSDKANNDVLKQLNNKKIKIISHIDMIFYNKYEDEYIVAVNVIPGLKLDPHCKEYNWIEVK